MISSTEYSDCIWYKAHLALGEIENIWVFLKFSIAKVVIMAFYQFIVMEVIPTLFCLRWY